MLGHSIHNCLKLSASNQQDATSIRDKAIPATSKVIRNQNQKVKPNPTSHFNMSVQPVVHNSEVHGSPLVADREQILNNISQIVVPDSFVSTNMVPKIVPIALDNTFGILNELEPTSDGEALVEDLNHSADSTQILSDKELSPENSVRKLDCGNILTWNNSFTMFNEDFPLLNGAAKISEQIGLPPILAKQASRAMFKNMLILLALFWLPRSREIKAPKLTLHIQFQSQAKCKRLLLNPGPLSLCILFLTSLC